MMKIGIIVAMKEEFRLVEELLVNKREKNINGITFVEGQVGDKMVILIQSGIGKVCSAVGVGELIRNYRPDYVINTGVAGGIDKILKVMDIVVGEKTVYHDVWCGDGNKYGQVQGMPAEYAADSRLCTAALSVKCNVNMHRGLICSGDQFITDKQGLERIKIHFPEGLAVDMESCSIAQVCYMYKIPFLSFRVISDTPGIVEDHDAQYTDFWKTAPEKSFEALKQLIALI